MEKTKITGLKLRDLVDAERALELLGSRQMEGKIGYRIAKVIRKSAPDIKQYRQGLQEKIEGTNAFIREERGIKLDPTSPDFEKHRKAIEKHRDDVLDADTSLGDGVGPIKIDELLDALPKRNTGTAEEPVWERSFIEPALLADLWWLIEE